MKVKKGLNTIAWELRRTADGWAGTIALPPGFAGCSMQTTAKGGTPRQALARAAGLAEKALSNPALQALLPPQAQIALKGAKLLAKYGNPMGLQAVLAKKGVKKLGKALKLW